MKKFIALLLALLFLCGCKQNTPISTQPTEMDEEILFVHFIDVGQADCTLLKLGDLDILIDGGNTEDSGHVYNYLNTVGVDDLELVISTHAHEDHYGGLIYVLSKVETEKVWITEDPYAASYYGQFLDAADDTGAPVYTPELGEVFSQDGLTVTVIGPVKDYSEENTNNTSLVVMVQYGETKILLTGDMEKEAETDLLASGVDLSADVLKVGHHGSYTSSSYGFLQAVGAEYGIIHVGRDNEYGHPHDATMKRLQSAGLTLYRTDLNRDLVVATDGRQINFLLTDGGATTPNDQDGTHVTIAQAIGLCQQAGEAGTSQNYYITGIVTEIKNDTYGNMYITDGTGEIYVYGVYGMGGDLRYDQLENPPKVGDRVTLYGSLALYRNEMPEMKNAWIVSDEN